MARVLIVEGASRGLRLAHELLGEGHAVRVLTAERERRCEIETLGAECFIATPDRLATTSGSLEHVTIACWLLADVSGGEERVRDLHGSRLERFIHDAIDSTLRGFVYEAGGSIVPTPTLAEGERIVSRIAARNSIPVRVLTADPLDGFEWGRQAHVAVHSLLEGRT